ncbi:MAG TPA: hypothetical protein VF138_12230 [Caulobacteraceae bacterium]
MKLPGGEDVLIDPRKLVDYALSPTHHTGRHKARVFASVLGLTARDAAVLADALRLAAAREEAELIGETAHGAGYRIRSLFRFKDRSAIIGSGWRVPADGSQTRLVTVYVARSR